MLVSTLNKLKASRELATIKLNDSDDTEITGYILRAAENIILVQEIDNDGTFDGFMLFKTEDVAEVWWGNREHRCIDALAREEQQPEIPDISSTDFLVAMFEVAHKFGQIGIYLYGEGDSFAIVEIVEYDETWLSVSGFGNRQTLSGLKRLLRFDDICRIEFDSPYMNDVVQLHAREEL